MKKDPFAEIKFHLEEVERDFLESHEIKKMIDKQIDIPRMAQVRDIYIFCCYSGLAFTDVQQLKAEHIALDINGAQWISKRRQKTKNMCNIPLLEIPRAILDKYKEHNYCIKHAVLLPVLSNQKMNSYLKELADICGINKQLTTHLARHNRSCFYLKIGKLQIYFRQQVTFKKRAKCFISFRFFTISKERLILCQWPKYSLYFFVVYFQIHSLKTINGDH